MAISKAEIAALLEVSNDKSPSPTIENNISGGDPSTSAPSTNNDSDNNDISRKRRKNGKKGRPNKPAHLKALNPGNGNSDKWIPTEWRIEYDRIVALHCLGYSNAVVGQELGYSAQHVSNILNLPEGKAMVRLVKEKFIKQTLDTIPERLNALQIKITERVEKFFDDDELFQKAPGAVVDRGISLLKCIGLLKEKETLPPQGGVVNVDKAIIVPAGSMDNMREALRLSMEIDARHQQLKVNNEEK